MSFSVFSQPFFMAKNDGEKLYATTYYVSPSGNDATGNGSQASPWKTLSKATSSVNTVGDIIHLTSGTFTETQQSSLRTGVSLEGEGKDVTIVKSAISGQWSGLLQLSSPQNTNGNQSISGITFDGQYVSESNFKTWVAIWVTGRSNVTITNCKIVNFYGSAAIFDGFDATSPSKDPGVTATGNVFSSNTVNNCSGVVENNYGNGSVMIGGQTGMVIQNNNIACTSRVNFKNGWPIKYYDNGYLKGCKILNNTLIKSPYVAGYWGEGGDWDFAIELFNIQGLEIGGNTIQGAIDLNYNYKGAYTYSVWIHDNLLNHATPNYSHPESGIIFEFATQSAIVEKNVINNAFVGISYNMRYPGNTGGYSYPCPTGGCSEVSDNIIRNNLFTNLYQAPYGASGAIILQMENNTQNPYVKNMKIYNNTFVAKSSQAAPLGIDFTSQSQGNVTSVSIQNNIFQGFSMGSVAANTAQTQNNILITNNDYYNTSAPYWTGGGVSINSNISANPLFVSATDFHLQPGSPCIGKGINLGSGIDIGCYQSGTTPPPNNPPVATAGQPQTITLPVNSVTLTGAGTDSDGTIVSYSWIKNSGPSATITSPSSANTTVTGLVQGVYVFKLTVTDNQGAMASDFVQITGSAWPCSPGRPPTARPRMRSPHLTRALPAPLTRSRAGVSASDDPGGAHARDPGGWAAPPCHPFGQARAPHRAGSPGGRGQPSPAAIPPQLRRGAPVQDVWVDPRGLPCVVGPLQHHRHVPRLLCLRQGGRLPAQAGP
jgi:hypothetical protein